MIIEFGHKFRIEVQAVGNGNGGPLEYRLVAYGSNRTLPGARFSSAIDLLNTFATAGIHMKGPNRLVNADKGTGGKEDAIVYSDDLILTPHQLEILGLSAE